MKCINCNAEIEKDDNFCHNCGYFTAVGYSYLKDKDNVDKINKGASVKQKNRFSTLIILFFLGTLLFFTMMFIRGDDLFKPILYLKQQINNYKYGYNTSIIKNDNKYSKEIINTYDDAIKFIKKDFSNQTWQCYTTLEVKRIEEELENKYSIPSVVFCDLSLSKVLKIKDEINKFYSLFPNNHINLTNITYTNLSNTNNIAYFQPMYQFVNIKESILEYNKVNKTQILLNSYYFNDKSNKELNDIVGDNYYVKDATLESTVVHELGHALSFSLLLKTKKINNITLETKDNYQNINNIIDEFNKGNYSNYLVNNALINYNKIYRNNLTMEEFAKNISKYAGVMDKNNNIIYDETIAEAIHDYYLHGDNMSKASREIIKIINAKLEEL